MKWSKIMIVSDKSIYIQIYFCRFGFFFNSELNFLRHLHKKGLETERNPWLDSRSSGKVAKRILSIPLSSVISCLPYKIEGKYRPRVCEVLFTETLGGSLGWVRQEGLVWFGFFLLLGSLYLGRKDGLREWCPEECIALWSTVLLAWESEKAAQETKEFGEHVKK